MKMHSFDTFTDKENTTHCNQQCKFDDRAAEIKPVARFQVTVSFDTIISLFLADVQKNACLESHFQHCFGDRRKAVFPLIFPLKWSWRCEFLPSGSALPSLSGIVKTPTMVCPSFLSSLYTSWPNRLWPITAILILAPLCVLELQTCARRKMKSNGIFTLFIALEMDWTESY